MKDIRTRALIGIVGLAAVGLASVGCSSSNDMTGGGGSTGSAGTGNAGSTGTGGTGTGGATGCAVASGALITDFSGAGGLSMGMPFTFQDTGLTAPVVSTTASNLSVTFNTGAPTTMYPYAGWGIPFDACNNVSSYTGVKFNISGTLSAGCTIQFSLGDKQHSSSPPLGTCTATSCYPGAKVFTLPATATDVTVLFSEIAAGGPATPIVVPAEAIGVQWQLNVPTTGCMGSVTIDNVTLL